MSRSVSTEQRRGAQEHCRDESTNNKSSGSRHEGTSKGCAARVRLGWDGSARRFFDSSFACPAAESSYNPSNGNEFTAVGSTSHSTIKEISCGIHSPRTPPRGAPETT